MISGQRLPLHTRFILFWVLKIPSFLDSSCFPIGICSILHPMVEYHGAVGGCAIYVSDKPGFHNFSSSIWLRSLCFLMGREKELNLTGRSTGDCLFTDPTMEKGNSHILQVDDDDGSLVFSM